MIRGFVVCWRTSRGLFVGTAHVSEVIRTVHVSVLVDLV